MNIQQARAQQASRLFGQPHQHGALTRRQFLKAGLATAVGVGLGQATAAMAGKGQPASAPRPIPYGSTFLFPDLTLFHVEAPGYPLPNPPFDTDPANADPSTITDFNGFVGLVYVGGLGTHHNLLTDETKTLYWEVDLRFMTGQYVGHDGRMHKGTFGFV
jgi:hypothetical protein